MRLKRRRRFELCGGVLKARVQQNADNPPKDFKGFKKKSYIKKEHIFKVLDMISLFIKGNR